MENVGPVRRRMIEILEDLASEEGRSDSPLEGVQFLRAARSLPRIQIMYEPCIVFVAQGRKRGYLGDQRFVYDAENYLTLTVPLPFECETEVDGEKPFLGVAVRLDLSLLGELMLMMGGGKVLEGAAPRNESSVTATPVDAALSGAVLRLLEATRNPQDAEVLGPQIVREIVYRVLQGQRGSALQSLMRLDSAGLRVHRVMHRMHMECAKPFDVGRVATDAGMSVSALHHQFKALTGTSPLQYLKSVRLHKARTLMAQESLGAAMAAERVGYESASQFSREFKRMFGISPTEETVRLRGIFGLRESAALRVAVTRVASLEEAAA